MNLRSLHSYEPTCETPHKSFIAKLITFSNNNNMDKIISFIREKNQKNRCKRPKKGLSVRHIICAINRAKCLELKTFDFE